MFELLFRYPPVVYAHGRLVLLGAWPAWVLAALLVAAGLGLAWLLWSRARQARLRARRLGAVWALEALLVALILILLWQPALSLAELKPKQNVIAVLVDDSRSMALTDGTARSREAAALATLRSGLEDDLGRRFQVRLYRMDSGVARVANLNQIHPTAAATRIGDSLRQLLRQTDNLPLGAIVLLTDGADNRGGPNLAGAGVGRDTLAALRSRHIPVHAIGFGATTPSRDVEMDDAVLPLRAMAKSRVEVAVRFHQSGFRGQHAVLTARSGGKVLATQPVTFGPDGEIQTANLMLNAGAAGPKSLRFSLSPLPGEANPANNSLTRLVAVSSAPRRVLYIEGEPRWEYKFIRRAELNDPQVQLVSMLRATDNKVYRQGISDPSELAAGFPSDAKAMFRYQGLIVGSVHAAYFTPVQQDLIRAFADRRGGGILFLGGEFALADGGWASSPLAVLLPVTLPDHGGTFVRADLSPGAHAHARARLAPAGAYSPITRLVEQPAANRRKWEKLPWLMDYQDAGTPKPGATVLADVVTPQGRTLPLLVTENYGLGRTAVLATSGTWRWQMNLPYGDPSHDLFWQQLVRWLVTGTPGPVTASVDHTMLYDHGQIRLTAQVRDGQYNPAPNAAVTAQILGPGGAKATVPLRPDPNLPGLFAADYTAAHAGTYVATVAAPGFGQDTVTFDRLDGVAENFRTTQNRDFLQRLAQQTGGRYWQPAQAARLASAIPFSGGGLSLRVNLPLWNLPVIFLLLLLLPLAEWFLRRRWGVV